MTSPHRVAEEPVGMLALGVPRPVWKTSEVVAFAVARDIVEHGLQFGDRLPLEAQMLEQYGVSRESLREALRLLEAQGIVSLRRGPGGGPVVGRASSMNLARTMTLYFQLAGATYEELLGAWRMLEPLAAELAARNPDRSSSPARFPPTSSTSTTAASGAPTRRTPTASTSRSSTSPRTRCWRSSSAPWGTSSAPTSSCVSTRSWCAS